MFCKQCGTTLPAESSPRRAFCSDAHKQAFYRERHELKQTRIVNSLKLQVNELEREIERLRNRLDIERRYLEDTTPQRFKAFLRKQPSSPWRVAFLNDQTIKTLASRSYCEAKMRSLHCTDEELEDFTRLWKLMLLQS